MTMPQQRPTTHDLSAGQRYLATTQNLLGRLSGTEWAHVQDAASAIADAVGNGRDLHVFGSGHSHMIAEELYYRAGGLVGVKPILFDALMLHHSTTISTELERLDGLAPVLLADHPIEAGDVILIASNSGGNAVSVDMARCARQSGATVIAITSISHATSPLARQTDAPRLHTLADIVIDNGGAVGDAAVEIAGVHQRVGPTSTVIGAALVNTLVAEVVELLTARGQQPAIYESLNTSVGDRDRIRRAGGG